MAAGGGLERLNQALADGGTGRGGVRSEDGSGPAGGGLALEGVPMSDAVIAQARAGTVLGTEEAVGAGTVGGRWRCWRRGGRRWW